MQNRDLVLVVLAKPAQDAVKAVLFPLYLRPVLFRLSQDNLSMCNAIGSPGPELF